MAKQIKGNEIIEDNHLANAIKQAEELLEAYTKLDKQIIKTAKDSKKVASATDLGSAKGIKTINQELQKSNELKKAAANIDKQIEKGEAKLTLAYTQQAKRLANLKLIQQRANKAAKEAAILSSKSSTAYEKESVRLNQLRKKLKDLILTEGQSSKATREMQKEVQRLDQRLKKADAAAGQFQRSVGGYRQAIQGAVGSLKNLAGALGVVGGVRLLTNVMRDSFNIVKDFGQSQADLASVLGKSVDEIKALTETAKELGATTKFTASEVANLQLEFAKLGFPEQEIQNMTEATLELAAASGTDLANAATIVGSTLNAFGLESTETQRLVDVMAKSFSSSSLDIDKFSSAMSNVAPAAAAVGLTIEETTALIGTLTDAGNDAGAAGTALRNMFIQTKTKGIEFEDALEQIANSSDQLATSFELFGKKGATLGVTLANNRDGAEQLTEKLENAAGAAGDMADKQLDTLNGALDLLRSAWEGYILGADGASGVSDKLKDIVKFLADNLETIIDTVIRITSLWGAYKVAMNAAKVANNLFGGSLGKLKSSFGGIGLAITGVIIVVNELIDAYSNAASAGRALDQVTEKVNERMDQEVAQLKLLGKELLLTNTASEERQEIIDKINNQYGTTLQNLEDEAAFVEQIRDAYTSLVKELREKIALQVIEEDLITAEKNLRKFQRALVDAGESGLGVEALNKAINTQRDIINALEGEYAELKQSIGTIDETNGDLVDGFDEVTNSAGKASKSLEEVKNVVVSNDKEIKKMLEDWLAWKNFVVEFDEDIQEFDDFTIEPEIIIPQPDYEAILNGLKSFAKEATELFKTIADNQIKEIDRVIAAKKEDIQESDQQINRLQALADQGNVEAAESLKAENIKQAKDKLEVERLEKKKKNLLIQLAFLQQANNLLQAQDPNALSNAQVKVGGFVEKIKGFFYKGTEKTVGHALGNTGTRDGHTVRVHDNEHIVGAEDSDKLHKAGFSKTSDIVNAALAHQNNAVNGRVMLMNTGLSWTDAGIIQELKSVKEAVKSMEFPTSMYDQETGKETVRKGNNVETFYHKPKTFRI